MNIYEMVYTYLCAYVSVFVYLIYFVTITLHKRGPKSNFIVNVYQGQRGPHKSL